jgi:hypothetical protein
MSSNSSDLAVGPAPAAPSRRPGRRVLRILLILGLAVVLAAAGTAAAAETYFRRHFEQCIASQTQQQIGSKVTVHFGAKPLLLTAIDHEIGSVTVDSDDAKFGPAVGMKVHVELHDIRMVDGGRGGATVANSSTEATWSDDGIAQTLTGLVSAVQSDPSNGTLDVKVLGGIATLRVRPHIVDDKIQVNTESAELLGLGLPTDLVDGIVKLMTESLQSYPLDQHPKDVQITGTGLVVKLAGGATKLEGDSNQTPASC